MEKETFKVYIMEYERGWGSSLDSTKEFDTIEEADEFVEKYNSKNTATEVPDWYMVAQKGY